MENLIVASEVIAMLRISPSTLDRYICQAKCGNSLFPLPMQYGVRGKRLWRKSDFEHWTKGCEFEGNTNATKALSSNDQTLGHFNNPSSSVFKELAGVDGSLTHSSDRRQNDEN